MSHYCGIDLHSNNHVVVTQTKRTKEWFEKRLNNDLSLTLKALFLTVKACKVSQWNPHLIGTGWSMACRNRAMIYSWLIPQRSNNTMA